MQLGVGVIGAGVMGADHARLIRSEISGARLVGVADADYGRAQTAAAGGWAGTDPFELIARDDVEAVIIASPDAAHAEQVLACIAAGKPVLCEKPLSPDPAACAKIIAAEAASRMSLVTLGFMRRFDPAYREIRDALRLGELGPLRVLHNIHRNQFVPHWFTADMAVMSSFVHEIDITRWLLGADPIAATVFRAGGTAPSEARQPADLPPSAAADRDQAALLGSASPAQTGLNQPSQTTFGPGDPLMIMLEMPSGALVSSEVFIDARYGYHVHAEAVCSEGTIAMAEPSLTRSRSQLAQRAAYPADWIPRFAEAYRRQDQAWVDAVRKGIPTPEAATAHDGLMATHIGRQVIEAMTSGSRKQLLPPSAS